MRSLGEILEDIDRFEPDPDGNFLPLDALLREAFDTKTDLTPAIVPLLRVFERFPRHDGYEVFWSIIHFLEHIDGYEHALIDSVKRCPTEMAVTMLRRLINAGKPRIDDVDLATLIAETTTPEIDYTL